MTSQQYRDCYIFSFCTVFVVWCVLCAFRLTVGLPKSIAEGDDTESIPSLHDYLSAAYMKTHLTQFENGVTKIVSFEPNRPIGIDAGGTFVMPREVADKLIEESAGDVRALEKSLGLEPGSLGDNPYRVDIDNPQNLRMPTGNEEGANDMWVPGGYTSPGGLPEATIDPVPLEDCSYSHIFR